MLGLNLDWSDHYLQVTPVMSPAIFPICFHCLSKVKYENYKAES